MGTDSSIRCVLDEIGDVYLLSSKDIYQMYILSVCHAIAAM